MERLGQHSPSLSPPTGTGLFTPVHAPCEFQTASLRCLSGISDCAQLRSSLVTPPYNSALEQQNAQGDDGGSCNKNNRLIREQDCQPQSNSQRYCQESSRSAIVASSHPIAALLPGSKAGKGASAALPRFLYHHTQEGKIGVSLLKAPAKACLFSVQFGQSHRSTHC